MVRAFVAAAQHQVGVRVAQGLDDRRVALRIHAEVAVRRFSAAHGIAGDGHATVGAVLEADRQLQAADHFPVDLRFGGARANRGPAQQVIEVPGNHRLQQLGGNRQATFDHVQHQATGQGDAGMHVVAAIEVRVIGQAFPAHRGTRFST